MDKPRTMSVKDYLIRVMSIKTNTSVKIIEAVVNHQMQSLNLAIQDNSIFTAELSGFGKFIFNHKKALKKYEKNISKEQFFSNALNTPDLEEKKIKSLNLKLTNTQNWMKNIKPKLQQCPNLQNISTLQ